METEEEDNSKKFIKKATKMLLPSNEVIKEAYIEGRGRSLPMAVRDSNGGI